MRNKKLILTIISVAIISINVIVGTYAYITAGVNDDASDTVTITSGSLSLTLNDMDVTSLTSWVITPVDLSRTVYLSITNNCPINVYAKLLFKGLTNTYSEYLAYSLEQVNSDKTSFNPIKVVKNKVRVPLSVNLSNKELANYLDIPAGQTYYYKLTIEYVYLGTENQTSDVEKKFYTGFGLEEGICPVRVTSKAKVSLATGDKIAIGDENFWVISNTNGSVKALAEYNLYVGSIYDSSGTKIRDISNSEAGYGLQNSNAKGWVSGTNMIGTVPYASTGQHGTNYSSYEGSILQNYISSYATLLNSTYGINVTGDAITKEELENSFGCSSSSNTCSDSSYPWIYTVSYWTKSAGANDTIWRVGLNAGFYNSGYGFNGRFGVRPVIIISESSFCSA